MKQLYLLILLLITTACAKAGDTLTYAQIYNFNIGDTFDYETTDQYQLTRFERKVLMQKIYTVNNDTLLLGFGAPGLSITEWHSITDLDSFAVFMQPNYSSACARSYIVDSTLFGGRISNTVYDNCFEGAQNIIFTKGLGLTRFDYWGLALDPYGEHVVSYLQKLIYYSNSVDHIGTPYTIANGSNLVAYVPLPEECAVWTRVVNAGQSSSQTIIEQIRTGNKIQAYGKTFVELICRIQNNATNHFTNDSLIGYFYNDTVEQAAFFMRYTTSFDSTLMCSFKGLNGGQCEFGGHLHVSTVNINGEARTAWYCYPSTSWQPDDCNEAIISGVGSLGGLIPVYHPKYSGGPGICGKLTSLCVCGQPFYARDSTVTCALLSDIGELKLPGNLSFYLSPNPATVSVTVHFDENLTDMPLKEDGVITITDITGRMLKTEIIRFSATEINLAGFANGIYLVTANKGQLSKTVKLAISK